MLRRCELHVRTSSQSSDPLPSVSIRSKAARSSFWPAPPKYLCTSRLRLKTALLHSAPEILPSCSHV